MAQKFSKQFYNSKEWRGIRASILKRDNYICQHCGMPALEIHHIVKLTPSNIYSIDSNKASNLISLCKDCHFREHEKDRGIKDDCEEGYYFDSEGNMQRQAST